MTNAKIQIMVIDENGRRKICSSIEEAAPYLELAKNKPAQKAVEKPVEKKEPTEEFKPKRKKRDEW